MGHPDGEGDGGRMLFEAFEKKPGRTGCELV